MLTSGYVLFCVFGLGAGDREKGENARLVQFTAVGRWMPGGSGIYYRGNRSNLAERTLQVWVEPLSLDSSTRWRTYFVSIGAVERL